MSLGAQPSFDAMSTFPQGFGNGLVVQGMPILNTYPGRVYWLDSVNGSDTNRGTFARPFATLMGAQNVISTQAPTVFNDVLMVKPGHYETITAPRTAAGAPSTSGGAATAGSMSIDLTGLQVIGLGIGDDRPQFNFTTANTATLNITGSNVTLQNLLFLGNFLSIASAINLGGAVSGTGIASTAAYISGNLMTVVTSSSGYLYPGSTLWSTTSGFLRGTKIVYQVSGTAGGVGVYYVNKSQTVGSAASTATITSVTRNVSILGCEFRDLSSVLGFITVVTTSTVNNAHDGFAFIGNTFNGLSTSGSAPVTLAANTNYVTISQNQLNSTGGGTGAGILTKGSKVCLGLMVQGNRSWRPDTANTGGMGIATTSTTDTGIVADNYILGGSGALTGLLIPTGGILGFVNNPIQQAIDKSGTVLPVVG